MLGFVVACVLCAAAIILVLDTKSLPTVHRSHETGEVVDIRDWRGNPVPDEHWDRVLSRRYNKGAWYP